MLQDGTGVAVDGIVVLVGSAPELDFILQAAVVPLPLDLPVGNIACGQSGVAQRGLLGGLLAHVLPLRAGGRRLGGAGVGGHRGVRPWTGGIGVCAGGERVLGPAEHLAGEGVHDILKLSPSGFQLHLIVRRELVQLRVHIGGHRVQRQSAGVGLRGCGRGALADGDALLARLEQVVQLLHREGGQLVKGLLTCAVHGQHLFHQSSLA